MVSRDIDDEVETWTIARPAIVSHGGVIAAQHIAAARAGAEIRKEAATLSTLQWRACCPTGVVEPWNSGIGGGGQLTSADSGTGRIYAVDFLPVAAASSIPRTTRSSTGHRARNSGGPRSKMTVTWLVTRPFAFPVP